MFETHFLESSHFYIWDEKIQINRPNKWDKISWNQLSDVYMIIPFYQLALF